jgi:hypothetical protein
MKMDPRLCQLAVLGGLLAYGTVWLDFDVTGARLALVLTTCLGVQLVCTRLCRL